MQRNITARTKRVHNHPWRGYRVICGVVSCPRVLGYARWWSWQETKESFGHHLDEEGVSIIIREFRFYLPDSDFWMLIDLKQGYSDYGSVYRQIDRGSDGGPRKRRKSFLARLGEMDAILEKIEGDVLTGDALETLREISRDVRDAVRAQTPVLPVLPVVLMCPCNKRVLQDVACPPPLDETQ